MVTCMNNFRVVPFYKGKFITDTKPKATKKRSSEHFSEDSPSSEPEVKKPKKVIQLKPIEVVSACMDTGGHKGRFHLRSRIS